MEVREDSPAGQPGLRAELEPPGQAGRRPETSKPQDTADSESLGGRGQRKCTGASRQAWLGHGAGFVTCGGRWWNLPEFPFPHL